MRDLIKRLHTSGRRPNALKPGHKRGAWWYIATWFGCGLSPVVSGTAGSLGALPFAFVIQYALGNHALFIASLLVFALGVWASGQYLAHMESGEDPGEIVVDEVAGQWLTLCVLFPTWQSYLTGFLLFRLFDILKPWPVSLADRQIKGAFGVMFDDMLAGAYPILVYLLILAEAHFFHTGHLLLPVMNFLGGDYVR